MFTLLPIDGGDFIKKSTLFFIIIGILLFTLSVTAWKLVYPAIPVENARQIAIKAALPPKNLLPREKWELRQINGKMRPQLFFSKGLPKKIYKFDVYYVDDALNMAYFGRTIYIDAMNGKIIKVEKAPKTRY